jgi:outer membrane receptor protein involved in Fe transport
VTTLVPDFLTYTNNQYNPANVPALTGLASADRSRAQQFVNDLTGTIGNINQTYNANVAQVFLPYDTRSRYIRQREWGAFFQDTWKVRKNLTIDLGLRWELRLAPGEKSG